jgi:hypothetical protein
VFSIVLKVASLVVKQVIVLLEVVVHFKELLHNLLIPVYQIQSITVIKLTRVSAAKLI